MEILHLSQVWSTSISFHANRYLSFIHIFLLFIKRIPRILPKILIWKTISNVNFQDMNSILWKWRTFPLSLWYENVLREKCLEKNVFLIFLQFFHLFSEASSIIFENFRQISDRINFRLQIGLVFRYFWRNYKKILSCFSIKSRSSTIIFVAQFIVKFIIKFRINNVSISLIDL